MKKLSALLVFVASLSALAQQSNPRSVADAQPGMQIRQEFLRAYNAKDVDGILALYADDATLVSDGGIFRGRSEIRNWVQSGLDQGSHLETIEPIAEKSSGTLAYGTGGTRRTAGSEIHLGRYLIVMEKIGNEWKIAQHFSVNAGVTPAANATSR